MTNAPVNTSMAGSLDGQRTERSAAKPMLWTGRVIMVGAIAAHTSRLNNSNSVTAWQFSLPTAGPGRSVPNITTLGYVCEQCSWTSPAPTCYPIIA